MLAASLPDLDGLGIVFGEEAYWRFHHVAGHNLVFGIVLSALFAGFATRRLLTAIACLVCFHLHLLMDYVGSGPGWTIHYLWPFDAHGYKTDRAWELSSWQNRVAFAGLLMMTIAIGALRRITPLECLAPRLDRTLTGRVALESTSPSDPQPLRKE